ncbi:MAG: SMP-30/gluconolactonase/LRE family protein [Polyangiales bacterium]
MLFALTWLGCASETDVSSGSRSSGSSGQPSPQGQATGGTGGKGNVAIGAGGSQGAGAGVQGGTGGGVAGMSFAQGGAGGVGMGIAGSGIGGQPGGGSGSGGTTGPVTYPMLDAAAIGVPTQVMLTTPVTLAEGPLWDPCGHQLLFVDVNASKIFALSSTGQQTEFMTNTSNANGIAFDPTDGSLILAQMGGAPGHVARRTKSGMVQRIDPPGSLLHTPDDVVVRSDGTIYFTDGDFYPIGTALGYNAQLPVYQIPPGTMVLKNGGTVSGPNGIELSPDEKTLYVDGFGEGTVWTFSVAVDGSVTKGKPLATGLTNPDSLCVDAAGNLYVGVKAGLQVLRPDGSMVKLIPITSSQGVTNCTFGDDGKTLYITAWTTMWKILGMPIPGLDFVNNTARLKC